MKFIFDVYIFVVKGIIEVNAFEELKDDIKDLTSVEEVQMSKLTQGEI